MIFGILGGDFRYKFLYDMLCNEDHLVYSHNNKYIEDKDNNTLDEFLCKIDILIVPIPFTKDNKTLFDIENEEEVLAYFSKFMEVRKDVLKSMEGLRNEKLIKSNMETKVTLSLKDEYKDIANLKDDLKQLFIVAKVELVDDTTLEEYETSYIKVEKFNGVQCPRCWNYFDEDEMNGELCSRCASVAHRVAE